MKKLKYLLAVVLMFSLTVPLSAELYAADKTTKYRVYQNTNILMEFADLKAATDYARQWSRSYVEEIGSRQWLWDNFPRYKVYQDGASKPEWEFAAYEDAVRFASAYSQASIRDLQRGGWVWNNYPRYVLYQGRVSLDNWKFDNLNDAIAEARNWGEAHIVDMTTQNWVWDNYSEERKTELREHSLARYRVYQNNYTQDEWRFGFLGDAVAEAAKWADSYVVNITDGYQVYHSYQKKYEVYQHSRLLQSFLTLDEAIRYAQQWDHARVLRDKQELWSNWPYYEVYQLGNRITGFHTIREAVAHAMQFNDASVRTYSKEIIWDNSRRLAFWAWNGSSSHSVIQNQVNLTMGLDVDSPTWFILEDASGNLIDNSNVETLRWLQSRGIEVHPLVNNQFNRALTTSFLSNPQAQQKFIEALVNRCAELGVQGINLDFEEVAGADRDKYTEFVRKLTEAAHAKGLKISIDLLRGSVSWNHLTAYDHEKIGQIVDYVVIMAYDQHWRGSTSPGSVSGLQWAEQGVVEFLSYGIPRDKLIMGIPFYVREWQLDGNGQIVSNRALFMKDLPELIRNKNAALTWDPTFQQYKAEYKENGFTYVFWLENEDTVKARLEIAKKYDLAGVAAWRLGYESASVWQTMLRSK